MMRRFFIRRRLNGFTVVELLVALLVLSIGLLGVALMTSMLTRGAKGASQMSKAVNLCQTKLEKMKEKDWVAVGSIEDDGSSSDQYEFGRYQGKMAQKITINELGNTWSEQFAIETAKSGSACAGESLPSESETTDCANALRELGSYSLTLTMTVCNGADYSNGVPPSGTTTVIESVEDAVKPYTEPDCRVKTTDSSRPNALACFSSDLTADPSSEAADDEKIVKVLCTWRSAQGSCFSVASETTLVDLNL